MSTENALPAAEKGQPSRDFSVLACACPHGPHRGAHLVMTPDRCETCGRLTSEQIAWIKAEALREYAADLDWKRPDRCPCDDPESCCGSEASCDAMQPSISVVGALSLRKRADAIYPPGTSSGGDPS